MVELFYTLLIFNQVTSVTPKLEARLRIQTTKEDTYYLLTKGQPVEIKVSGPGWLRIYTRIPWTKEKKGTQIYKLILQEDNIKERFVSFETEYSRVAKIDKIGLSKWRSFYINVPDGLHTYRFIHWRAPSDTILLKFTNESPKRWKDITPLSYNSIMELVEDERIVNYFELTPQKGVILELDGPKRLKVISRLNIPLSTPGEQTYTIEVKEKGKRIKSVSFRAYPSETVYYKNRSDMVPSNPHNLYLNIPKGMKRYEFSIDSNWGGGLRFMVEER